MEKASWRRSGAVCIGFVLSVAASAIHAEDPASLQERAIERIDAYIRHFQTTGDRQSRVRDLEKAEAELGFSNQSFAARGELSKLAHGLVRLGQIARMRGDWDKAVEYYRQAELEARRSGDGVLQARALTGFALAEVSRRNLGAAAGFAGKAIPLAETGSEPKYLFDALDVAGQIQIAQGDLNAAVQTLNRAIAVAGQAHDDSLLVYGYLDRADAYLKRAERCDYERDFDPCIEAVNLARSDYTDALRLAKRLKYAGLAAFTDSALSNLTTREQLIRAQAQSHRLVSSSAVFAPKVPGDVLVTERFAPNAGLPGGFETLYEAAKSAEKQAGGFAATVVARSRYLDGLFRQARGDHDGALASFLEAVRFLERDRGQLRNERDRGTFFEDKVEFYYAAILELLERGRQAEAFDLMERSRARTMADVLAARNLDLGRAEERALYAEAQRLRSEIAARQVSLLTLSSDPQAGAERERIAKDTALLETQFADLTARMQREAPRLGDLLVSQPASLDAMQKSMREENYEALEYLVLEHAVILWHVSADAVHVRNVFLPRSQVIDKVSSLTASLSDPSQPFDEVSARELYLYLVQPARQWIKSDRLVIIPHEHLNYLPFQVLLEPANGRYLGERAALSVAPSATVLLGLKRARPTAGATVLAIADPELEAGREEVQAVIETYKSRGKVISETLARETDVKRWVGQYDVVHLAVHGKFNATEPLLSYLKLGRGGADDGALSAAEMFGLPLERSRLVVLSACETGKARATHASELFGMQRALLYAGANALVLSYWPVDSDATAVFMRAFHVGAQTASPAAAARAALTAVKQRPDYAHPYFWSAFMVLAR